jgi:hypothetical protein
MPFPGGRGGGGSDVQEKRKIKRYVLKEKATSTAKCMRTGEGRWNDISSKKVLSSALKY